MEQKIVLVSACLLGVNCRYDGGAKRDANVIKWLADKLVIPVCPESLSGLGFPRAAAEIDDGDGFTVLSGKASVLLKDGTEVTREFLAGAKETLKLAKMSGAKLAILKDRSPSCGVEAVYNRGKRVRGVGIFTALLIREGITVLCEKDFPEGPAQKSAS
jgi:uncharacterized protein YbbK (DUF523 family)